MMQMVEPLQMAAIGRCMHSLRTRDIEDVRGFQLAHDLGTHANGSNRWRDQLGPVRQPVALATLEHLPEVKDRLAGAAARTIEPRSLTHKVRLGVFDPDDVTRLPWGISRSWH